MKRKLVSILCAATMLIAMTACGRSDVQGTVTSTKDNGTSTATTVSTSVSTVASTEASTETFTKTSTETPTEASTETSTELSTESSAVTDTSASTETVVEEPNDDSAIKPGTVTFNEYEKSSVYENKYFGIGAVFDSSWGAWDAQWLWYAEGDYRDLSKEDYAMMLEVFSSMGELHAGRPYCSDGSDGYEDIGVNISVCTDEELNATEAQLIEAAMSQLANAHAVTNVNVEYRDITFAGAEHRGTYLTYPSGGGTNYEVTMIIKKGKYLYNIYIHSSNADDLESYINMFYEVK